jgi:hypothetical protein
MLSVHKSVGYCTHDAHRVSKSPEWLRIKIHHLLLEVKRDKDDLAVAVPCADHRPKHREVLYNLPKEAPLGIAIERMTIVEVIPGWETQLEMQSISREIF